MIGFSDAGKAYRDRKGVINWVLRDFSGAFTDGQNIGILAPHGQGKTTLINLAAGNENVSEGRVFRQGRISWPYTSRSFISTRLSGKQNLRFLTDIYGRNFSQAYEFVAEFSDLGRFLDAPLKRYTHEMKARLCISALFAMDFSHLLVDENLDGGDAAFRKKSARYLEDNRDRMTLLIATSNPTLVSKHCQSAGVLNNGRLTIYGSVPQAVEEFEKVNRAYV